MGKHAEDGMGTGEAGPVGLLVISSGWGAPPVDAELLLLAHFILQKFFRVQRAVNITNMRE